MDHHHLNGTQFDCPVLYMVHSALHFPKDDITKKTVNILSITDIANSNN